jgi:hypothetical protein
VEEVVKYRIRTTLPTFMCDEEVHDKVDTLRCVREESRQLDVSTMLTPLRDS